MGVWTPTRAAQHLGYPQEGFRLLQPWRQRLFAEALFDTQYVLQKIPTPGVKIA